MSVPVLYDMINLHQKMNNKTTLTQGIWLQKNYHNLATYFLVDELRDTINTTIQTILKKPKHVRMVHKLTEDYTNKYFNSSREIEKENLEKISDSKLINVYKKWMYWTNKHHGPAITTTWFIDSDGEDFSKLLLNLTENIIKRNSSKLSTAEVFSELTTPERISMDIKEEIESLKIVRLIQNNKKAQKIFKQKNVEKVKSNLDQIDIKLKNKLVKHYKKWLWMPYTYIGPAYDLDYYLMAWSGLIREKVDAKKHINKLQNMGKVAKSKKEELYKQLSMSPKEIELFAIASEIIYLKSYRKSAMFYACFVLEKIHKEIGKRLNISLKQVRFIATWEMEEAINKNYFSEHELNERIKFSLLHQKGLKGTIYTGVKAKAFLKKQKFEKEKIIKTNNLNGTPACPGKTKGVVKIINCPEDMVKMEKDDVMVALTTYPALLPAMKKASAIITDDGGITCHAAIVARELKTPCIVGTKIATKVLKDGDKVEVDADNGIVKILK